MLNVGFQPSLIGTCPAGDDNRDGEIHIEEVSLAVGNALFGCNRKTVAAG